MPPPPDLAERRLPLLTLESGHRLVRVHGLGRDPLFFGPGPGSALIGRWDSPEGRFGTCYFADGAHAVVAFAERFLRDPQRTLIPEAELDRAAVSIVQMVSAIRVVNFHGPALRRIGASAAVAHGDQRESRLWAQGLFDHTEVPGGLRWRSRVDDDGFAVALFDRSRRSIEVIQTEALLESRTLDIEACLERYRAAVVERKGWSHT